MMLPQMPQPPSQYVVDSFGNVVPTQMGYYPPPQVPQQYYPQQQQKQNIFHYQHQHQYSDPYY